MATSSSSILLEANYVDDSIWKADEDDKLQQLVTRYGEIGKWYNFP